MALFHLSVTQTKRSAGQSAIASAAYRAGERLYSEYYGEYSDYTRKGGVICSDNLKRTIVNLFKQHSYCTDISWENAQPGDLVFYPDNSHVGIVGGRGANGKLLIIHCASGYNNVVITGKEGFTSVGRPQYYGE